MIQSERDDKRSCNNSDENDQTSITVLACMSAAGKLMTPTILFPGQRFTFKPQMDFPEADMFLTQKGVITSDAFLRWLKETFIPGIKVMLFQSPRKLRRRKKNFF